VNYEEPVWRKLSAEDVHQYITDEMVEETAVYWGVPIYARPEWGKWLAFLMSEHDKLQEALSNNHSPVLVGRTRCQGGQMNYPQWLGDAIKQATHDHHMGGVMRDESMKDQAIETAAQAIQAQFEQALGEMEPEGKGVIEPLMLEAERNDLRVEARKRWQGL
jgi:hypothetical protein